MYDRWLSLDLRDFDSIPQEDMTKTYAQVMKQIDSLSREADKLKRKEEGKPEDDAIENGEPVVEPAADDLPGTPPVRSAT